MKILYFGNSGNLGYQYCRWLRESGVDATLALQDRHHEKSKPEWVDPAIKDNYPDWIVVFSRHSLGYLYPPEAVNRLAERADIVLTSGENILPALVLGKPVVFIPEGSDISRYPFERYSLKRWLRSFVYRKRIRNVSAILTAQDNCVEAAEALGVGDKVIRMGIPADVDKIRSTLDQSAFQELREKYDKYDLVILAASRKHIDPAKREIYKGSEKILGPMQSILKKYPEKTIRLVFTTAGEDWPVYKEMIEKKDLTKYSDFFDFLPWPLWYGYLNLENLIVCDEFGFISETCLGGIAREALSIGTPYVAAIDVESEKFIGAYSSDCPIYTAFDEEDIFSWLEDYLNKSQEERQQLKKDMRNWADETLDYTKSTARLISVLKSI